MSASIPKKNSTWLSISSSCELHPTILGSAATFSLPEKENRPGGEWKQFTLWGGKRRVQGLPLRPCGEQVERSAAAEVF